MLHLFLIITVRKSQISAPHFFLPGSLLLILAGGGGGGGGGGGVSPFLDPPKRSGYCEYSLYLVTSAVQQNNFFGVRNYF